jgi:hypothetical protein
VTAVAPLGHDMLPQARQPSGGLGRRCACGGHVIGGGECAQCRARRLQAEASGKRAAPVREAEAQPAALPQLSRDLSRVPPTKAAAP